VWEWVQDWYGAYPKEELENPTGQARGDPKVLSGGSWVSYPRDLRVSNRDWVGPEVRVGNLGFRCARELLSLFVLGRSPTGNFFADGEIH
jgi:formylglycine-generating enzyme required for sulfatase activity